MKSKHDGKSLIIIAIINRSTLTPCSKVLAFSSSACMPGLVKWGILISQIIGLQVCNGNKIRLIHVKCL